MHDRMTLFFLFGCAFYPLRISFSLWCFETELWTFEDSFEGRGDGNNTRIKLCIVKISAKILSSWSIGQMGWRGGGGCG